MSDARPLFALLVSALAGCEAPPLEEPDLETEVPQEWIAGEKVPGAIDPQWWRRFEDPGLDAIVLEALERNHDLRAAFARLERAVALAEIAGADLYPWLDGAFDASRERLNFIGFPIPGTGDDEVASATFTRLGLALNLSWEVDLWGRLRARSRAALADVQAAGADLAGEYLLVTATAVKSWFSVTAARRQVELARATVEAWQRTEREVRDRVEIGLSPSLELRLASSDLATAESLHAQRREELARRVRALEVLLGRYPAGAVEGSEELPSVPGPVPAGLPSEMLRRRPDIAGAERRLAAAESRVDESVAALYPRLALTASGGTSSVELGDLLDGDFRVWSIGANLFVPIFEGGRLRAAVKVSEAEGKAALEAYIQTVLNAFAEVESALVSDDLLREQEERLVVAVAESRAAERLADDRYRQGVEAFLTVLDSQRRALLNESLLISVHQQRLDNRVDLHLALGGGLHDPALQEAGMPPWPQESSSEDEP